MKITFDNFRKVYPEVEKWLDEETKRDFKDSEGLDEFYSQDDEIKGMFDTIINEMNQAVDKHEGEGKKEDSKEKPAAKPVAPKEKNDYTVKKVDYLITNIKELSWSKPSGFSEAKEWADDEKKYCINDAHISKEINFTRKVTDADLSLVTSLIDDDCDGGGYSFQLEKRKEIITKYGEKYQYVPYGAIMTNCISVLENGKPVYVIDAQGYNYARYIFVATSDSKIDKKRNYKWLEDNFEEYSLKKIMADLDKERAKHHGYAKGDIVVYQGKKYPIKDFFESFDESGVVLDTFGSGVVLEDVPYSKIRPAGKDEEINPVATPKEKPEPKPSAPKSTPAPFKGKYVDQLSEEVKIIARFITLQGKTMDEGKRSKNAPRIQLKALQTAIREKRIRKTSQYAKEIMEIQYALIRMVNGSLSGTFKDADIINITDYDHYKEIAESEKVSEITTFAKAFIRIQETAGKEKEAKSLLTKIEKSKESGEEIENMKRSLKQYIDGKSDKLKASEKTLRGLYGIAGDDSQNTGVMNSLAIENKHFEVLDFKGKWEGFFGRPELHFKFMFYGRPGNGKSTLALQLAGYLSNELGKRVLYVAKEEGFGYTLQEKIIRLGVSNPNLFLADNVPADLSAYDVVFLDSVNTLGLEPEDLGALPQDKAYVYVFQSTKDGKYMGKQEYAHNADAVVKIEQMTATKDKNRFGGEVLEFKVG